jgi:uncharacterized transporter YbjL
VRSKVIPDQWTLNGLSVVLLLRIYVLYSRSRVVGIFIGTLLFAGLCAAGVLGKLRPTVSGRLPVPLTKILMITR